MPHLRKKGVSFSLKRFVVHHAMKVDAYTKIILTIIAAALLINIAKPIMTPSFAQTENSRKFEHLQMGFVLGMEGMVYFFDSVTGNIWLYGQNLNPIKGLKLVELGEPLKEMDTGEKGKRRETSMDMRAIGTALGSYQVDNNMFPINHGTFNEIAFKTKLAEGLTTDYYEGASKDA